MIGRNGLSDLNLSGVLLLDCYCDFVFIGQCFCASHELVITNTMFELNVAKRQRSMIDFIVVYHCMLIVCSRHPGEERGGCRTDAENPNE